MQHDRTSQKQEFKSARLLFLFFFSFANTFARTPLPGSRPKLFKQETICLGLQRLHTHSWLQSRAFAPTFHFYHLFQYQWLLVRFHQTNLNLVLNGISYQLYC